MAAKLTLANMNPAARAARIKQLISNPGTRASIPTQFLPAQFQAARKTAQANKVLNSTLYNPAQILSGSDLRNAVTAEVNQTINPKISAFDRLIQSLTGQRDAGTKRLGDYFNLYNSQTAGAAAGIGNTQAKLTDQNSANAATAQSSLDKISQGITDRNAADAAVRGPGLQDSNPAQAVIDNAKTNAAGASKDYGNQASAQAAGYAGLANTIASVGPMRATDAMAGLNNKFNEQIFDAQSKRADVEASRGDLTTKTLNDMRNDQFTNLATMKGLDIRQQDLNETVRSNKAGEVLTGDAIDQRNKDSVRDAKNQHERNLFDQQYKAAQLDIKRGIDPVTHKPLPKKPQSGADALNNWKLKFAQDHGYLPQTGPGTVGGGKGTHGGVLDAKTGKRVLTQNEINTNSSKYGQITNAVSLAAKDFPGNRQTGGVKAGQALIKERPDVDPLFISIALDAAYDGFVSRVNEAKLRNRGLVPQDFGLKTFQQFQAEKKKTRKGPAGKVPGFGNTP